jgi:hypothetical protein
MSELKKIQYIIFEDYIICQDKLYLSFFMSLTNRIKPFFILLEIFDKSLC